MGFLLTPLFSRISRNIDAQKYTLLQNIMLFVFENV